MPLHHATDTYLMGELGVEKGFGVRDDIFL